MGDFGISHSFFVRLPVIYLAKLWFNQQQEWELLLCTRIHPQFLWLSMVQYLLVLGHRGAGLVYYVSSTCWWFFMGGSYESTNQLEFWTSMCSCFGPIVTGWNIWMNSRYIGNHHPNLLSYFSEGLKPPIR